jgi:hypothetical protein
MRKGLPKRDGPAGEGLHLRLGAGGPVHHLPVGFMNLEPTELLAELGRPGLGENECRPKLRHGSDKMAERSALGGLLELLQLAFPLPHHVQVAGDAPVEPKQVRQVHLPVPALLGLGLLFRVQERAGSVSPREVCE